ncbi:MAG: hypothetical protein WC662_00995 [Candidatus Paceibacterota bacterium]|jgi:hypothetical protein
MINLIPIEEKKRQNRIFYFKLIVVFLWVLGFLVLITSIIITPSYFASNIKKSLIVDKIEAQKNERIPVLDQEALLAIKDLNNKISLIEDAQKNEFLVSQNVINEILLKKMPDIKINQISYENNLNEGAIVQIRGSAPSRERLLSFRKSLEDDSFFLKVNLPISNFVKGSDIQFYLSLIPS